MWVWDRPQVKALVAFATKNGVPDLFVSVPPDLPTSGQLTWFRTLRTRTTAAGIRVHALGSETSWIDDVPAALRWQAAALGTGLFDGVHLDVEPWLHAAWGGADQAAMLGRHLGLLDQLAVMSHRTTVTGPDSITAIGAATLDAGARAGRPVRLAVETNHLGSDPVSRKQTFWGFTRAQLTTKLAAVDTAGAGSPSYAGMAVHDRVGWEALRRR